jgi:hypothetical protein
MGVMYCWQSNSIFIAANSNSAAQCSFAISSYGEIPSWSENGLFLDWIDGKPDYSKNVQCGIVKTNFCSYP